MSQRRILCLWFPRLAAERVIRGRPDLAAAPFALVADPGGALSLASLSPGAEALGLRRGMALGDARAIVPSLVTQPVDPRRQAAFLAALRRWAGRFSPWVAEEGEEALVLDITGCAHLFGGEQGLVDTLLAEAEALGLTVRSGLADTLGAAWALAHFAGAASGPAHVGDAIDQEARATRSRARKRCWERGGPPPAVVPVGDGLARIAPPAATLAHIGPLPVAALRLDPEEIACLNSFGLRRIADIAAMPRAQLTRRIGVTALRRFDQALGTLPEPVSPARPAAVFALRLSFPEPIGREADILAGIDRLLGPLCARLGAAGRGARRLRLGLIRVDGAAERREIGLARPSDRPEVIRPLLALRLGDIDAGFGIEALRLEAHVTEPLLSRQAAGALPSASRPETGKESDALGDLLSRIGARLGLEALTRLHPVESHIPERSANVMAVGCCAAAPRWPRPAGPRPIVIFAPEALAARDSAAPPRDFVWRRGEMRRCAAFGPERIAPEWWRDDPAWRAGPRDYWRVETQQGLRLWIYQVRGARAAPDWFAQGIFA